MGKGGKGKGNLTLNSSKTEFLLISLKQTLSGNRFFTPWSECVTNFEVRRRTGQPLLSDTVRADQTPEVVWPRGPGRQVSRSFPCSTSLHITCPKELEAASRSSKTYLAKNGGGRPAPI